LFNDIEKAVELTEQAIGGGRVKLQPGQLRQTLYILG
jgi:hypothetical protein